MSTRCMIGMKKEDGTVRAIYCHHDGYPLGVGATLLQFYQDVRKINQLMELGFISALGVLPVSQTEIEAIFGTNHCTGSKQVKYNGEWIGCDDYGTGEGMEHNQAVVYASEAAYLEEERSTDRDYIYLYKDGEWYSTTRDSWSFEKLSVE